jgi:hypothetical protein
VVGVGGAELEVEAALDVGEGVAGADEGEEHVVHRPPNATRCWSSCTDGSLVERLDRERERAAPAWSSSRERSCHAAEKVAVAKHMVTVAESGARCCERLESGGGGGEECG